MKVLRILKPRSYELFINIKVDREERPDLDFIFQSSFQLFNQTGWLAFNNVLDENGVPFMWPYFPKESRHGSFFKGSQKVSNAYKDQRENIIKQKIIKNLDLKKCCSESRT